MPGAWRRTHSHRLVRHLHLHLIVELEESLPSSSSELRSDVIPVASPSTVLLIETPGSQAAYCDD